MEPLDLSNLLTSQCHDSVRIQMQDIACMDMPESVLSGVTVLGCPWPTLPSDDGQDGAPCERSLLTGVFCMAETLFR